MICTNFIILKQTQKRGESLIKNFYCAILRKFRIQPSRQRPISHKRGTDQCPSPVSIRFISLPNNSLRQKRTQFHRPLHVKPTFVILY